MVYIDKVHYETDWNGNELYISELKWTNDLNENAFQNCTKDELIAFINNHSGQAHTKYQWHGYWYDGEEIHVVDNRFLRTDRNNTKADNLGNLPRY